MSAPTMMYLKKSAPPCARFAVVINAGTLFAKIDSFAITLGGATEVAEDLKLDGDDACVMEVKASGRELVELGCHQ